VQHEGRRRKNNAHARISTTMHNNMHNNRGTIQKVPKSKQSNALVTMMSRT
jgi:hypothetical protein